MDGMKREDWISTAEAAQLLGYCGDSFRRKFLGILPSRRPDPKANIQWLKSAVLMLAAASGGWGNEPTG